MHKIWVILIALCLSLLGCGGGTHGTGDVDLRAALLKGQVLDSLGNKYPGVKITSPQAIKTDYLPEDFAISDEEGRFELMVGFAEVVIAPDEINPGWAQINFEERDGRPAAVKIFVPETPSGQFNLRVQFDPVGREAKVLDFDVIDWDKAS